VGLHFSPLSNYLLMAHYRHNFGHLLTSNILKGDHAALEAM
jgi:hypothetical protein